MTDNTPQPTPEKIVNSTGKHDALYILAENNSRYHDLEIVYSLTSLIKHCSSWLRNIHIVGCWPKCLPTNIELKLNYVKCDDPYIHSKDANIIHKINYGIDHIEDLTEDFLICSDDQLVTKKSEWEDFRPRFIAEFDPKSPFFINKMKNSPRKWNRSLWSTLIRYYDPPKNQRPVHYYQPHIFSPFNKMIFKEMLKTVDITKDTDIIIFSLYYNFAKPENPCKSFDHVFFNRDLGNWDFVFRNFVEGIPRHIAFNDKAFLQLGFRKSLDKILGVNYSIYSPTYRRPI